ncbi:2-hydroxyglutaryl-CoA dehydratase D-component [Desulfatibacillum aliphaticivorans]|uniref:2-hydroxyglutaryl-CoA dehydratase D-component n=1 Tax=Desulfatibacillum aliphaticivorans TaxID=218208 RepID=B8FGK5_DESAL|nr:2-hydroxyacyl-CoA dehydratase family protein [Desulfatibacillum aliphaticivorans]ACL04914.1 2-hydroxyglutaryl-CoA dehydratase D-component [Desulfatibacillum aliphaticivorans]
MNQTVIPDFFRQILDQPVNNLVDQAQEQGKKAIAYTCSYVPQPLLSLDGVFPIRVRAPGVVGTPMADTYLSSVICSYTRSVLELALEWAFDSLDGWVFAASCDHLRRLYDNLDYLNKPAFNHMIDMPHRGGAAAEKWLAEEYKSLGAALAESFGVDASPQALSRSIKEHNAYLSVMREISKMRKQDNPPVTGAMFQTLLAASTSAPKDMVMDELKALLARLREGNEGKPYRARVLLAGSHCDDPGYIDVIEKTGGLVVAERTCTGSIPALAPIPENDAPYETLAGQALANISCPRMMESFQARVDEILEAVEEYRADGVVLQTMKFCDTWGVESGPMVQELRKAGIPILKLEREYAMSSEGQLQTRIQAFLESMGK